jgi:hypothetical protein
MNMTVRARDKLSCPLSHMLPCFFSHTCCLALSLSSPSLSLLCLPTFSHFFIVNKTSNKLFSLSLSRPPPLSVSLSLSLSLSHSLSLSLSLSLFRARARALSTCCSCFCEPFSACSPLQA